ncbi:prephenate dehydrogenase, partial [Priestia megaterium]
MKTRVLLIGVGLIGGSLALAMKKHRHVTVVG